MKKLIAAGAMIALLASPAFAQTIHHRVPAKAVHENHNVAPPAMQETDNGPEGKIIWGHSVKGQDPDPFIRESITRGLGNYGGD